MSKGDFTYLKEAIHRYQQCSDQRFRQVQHQLPSALGRLAERIQHSSLSNSKSEIGNVAKHALNHLQPVSEDLIETVRLANDYACDKVQALINEAEQKL